ncbi:Cytochrome oxidase biogenesis protein Cox11-CtaG copper delivery to Cox1 [Paramagnetospirillum magnetotacticum MS-1]|uniref:Cytochrome c oxidase assembly protein CtaG n=1 Tax=Paramagnetospirillum magnetotacticum MS-1 TaxID=272627 RepID=A0A0C2YF39_PARME|nr:cytochrome c oxidase assembly protein [Paramagnetospirillum magnetotacticum]KIL98334.1 Cytochrome oxidase biogenesis protein Cox11-CtaG copper delivery to Cox1 [Paramagnetospirillum magnetotacticum MS-1]
MTSQRRSALTLAGLVGIVLAMVGLVIGSVPLYKAFCQATGIGGPPRQVAADSASATGKMVTVRFDASVAKGLQWRFTPQAREMKVRLGEDSLAVFTATNLSDRPITGNAVYNATPDKIGRYVSKIQCFCFTEQTLEPGQSVDMAVSFVIDPAMAADPLSNEVSTITLSYTFFNAKTAQDERGRS